MAWTDSDLQAAFSALSPAPPTLADAVTALKAQTQTGIYVDVPAQELHDTFLIADEYGKLLLATQSGSTQPATVQSVILALKSLIDNNRTIQLSNAAVRSQVSGWLATLQGASLISPATVATLSALTQPTTAPKWAPQPIVADLQRLQHQGLIPSSIAAN